MKWFVSYNEEALGPFETEDIKQAVDSGNFKGDWLIWGRVLKGQWITLAQWQQKLPQILESQGPHPDPGQQMWHYAIGGKAFGPMTRDQLITTLHAMEEKNQVMVWTKGMTKWSPLFEFHDLMEDIGVNQRKHTRARINGSIVITTPDGNSMFGQLQSISAGGLGVTGVVGLRPGTNIDVDIRSEHLNTAVKAKAEVLYVNKVSFCGIKFTSIHMEAQSAIIDYIRGITATAKAA